jgi:hypothetical protein
VGILNAIGMAAKPMVFTSGETSPAPGDWVGIWLNRATDSRLDYVEISYAGASSSIVSASRRPVNTPENAAFLVGDFSTQQANIFNSVDLPQTNTFVASLSS